MKAFQIHSESNGRDFFNDYLPVHPKNEVLLLGFSSIDLVTEFLPELAAKATELTRLYLKVKDSDLDSVLRFKTLIEQSKISMCVEMSLDPLPTGPISTDLFRDTPIQNFSQASLSIKKWYSHFPLNRITAEFLLNESSISALAPTLQYLSSFKVPFILIDPGHLKWDLAQKVKDQLLHFEMYGITPCFVYISPDHPYANHWEARTDNTLRGPRFLDIDLSNACTHNCNFCGLYADDVVEQLKKNSGGELTPEIKSHMKSKIDTEVALKLIDQLPDKIEILTFGGMGDPMTHTSFFEIVETAMQRGFKVSVISNFAYFTDDKVERLTQLASTDYGSIYFLVNLSAANAETYKAIRSNQTDKTFERVVGHLKLSGELREKYGRGIQYRIISVTTKDNYKDLPDMVALTKHVKGEDLWIKPLEIHGEESKKLLIKPEELLNYALKARLALHFADHIGVSIYDRQILESLISENAESIQKFDQTQKSFTDQIRAEVDQSNFLKIYYNEATKESVTDPFSKANPWQSFNKYNKRDFLVPEVKTKVVNKTRDNLGVIASGSFPSTYFSEMPCHIGYEYLRITVNSEWLPCCISNYPIQERPKSPFLETWLSGRMTAFREKTKRIHKEKFHMTDPQWKFCQQCVHRLVNEDYNRRAGLEVVFSTV